MSASLQAIRERDAQCADYLSPAMYQSEWDRRELLAKLELAMNALRKVDTACRAGSSFTHTAAVGYCVTVVDIAMKEING